MTTIGNDAFTVGTAATAAGLANIAAQKKAVIKSLFTNTEDLFIRGAKASIKKDTYTKFAGSIKEALKKTVDKETYKKIARVIGDTAKKAVKADTYKNAFNGLTNKLTTSFSSVNWKTAGKYALVAAGIAAVAVAAKNFFFPSNEEDV